MSAATWFGLGGAAIVGLGLFGVILHPEPLRKVLAFNLLGSGVFVLLGVLARRGGGRVDGVPFADPVPQALIITGLVVAFAATVLAVALVLRLTQKTRATQPAADGDRPPASANDVF